MADQFARLTTALADRYRITRELGAGGMATVYLAEDVRHHRQVAVKVLRPDLAVELGPERFLREIDMAAQLQHPHIVPLHDSGEADGFLFYVMPYVEGPSLREKLARDGALPLDEAERILREVVDAVSYAHEHGVVHRDIKPDNVMLSGRHALITDFGVAKALRKAAGPSDLTAVGVPLGTPAYMAPEQAAADDAVDHRADIYAIGVLAYELVAGRPPFVGESSQHVLAAHLTESPTPVTEHRPDIPPALADTIMRCLAKEPGDRWQSADELLVRLQALVTPGGGVTFTATRPLEAQKRRRPVVTGLALAGVVAVMAVGSWALSDRQPAEPSGPTRIAVLPFDDVSATVDDAFSSGVTLDINTQLQKVREFVVLPPRSVQQLQIAGKSYAEIGAELGVRHVVHGEVRRAGNSVRVTVRLIDCETEEQRWANTFDEEPSIDNYFTFTGDVAAKVATRLLAALSPEEQRRIASLPTENWEAYGLYSRGRYFAERSSRHEDQQTAERMFREAVNLDPGFALAYASLSQVHSGLYFLAYDRSERRLTWAREAAERALELEPGLPEAHLALGNLYYYSARDYDRALGQYAIAERSLPNDAELTMHKGAVKRRQGEWEEAISYIRRAAALDPLNPLYPEMLGNTFATLGQYDEAIEAFDRATAIAPEYHEAAVYKAFVAIYRDQDTGPLRSLVPELPQNILDHFAVWRAPVSWQVEWLDRDFRAALGVLSDEERPPRDDQPAAYPRTLLDGLVHHVTGKRELARAAFDSALVVLRRQEETSRDDPRLHRALGYVYAGLGRKDEAIREGRRSVELLPVSKDHYEGPDYLIHLAWIYAMVGELDSAVVQLEHYLGVPSLRSVEAVLLDPRTDVMRGHRGFQSLVERYQ